MNRTAQIIAQTHTLHFRLPGFVVFLADIVRVAMVAILPIVLYLVVENGIASARPDLFPEFVGASIIIGAGAVILLCMGPLYRPLKRLVRWALDDNAGFANYR